MTSTRTALFVLTLLAILATCNANFFEFIMSLVFGVDMKQRSMSEIITDLLDEIFPKDDMDTKAMKNIFTMYNEEGNNLLDNQYTGLDYLEK